MTRLLVADDDPDVRGLLCRIGRRAVPGVQITTSVDGLEALEALMAQSFHLAIVDNQMPGMTGLQIARYLRRHGAATPLVLLTGWATHQVAREALAAGVVDLQEKPVMPMAMLSLVRAHLQRPERRGLRQGQTVRPQTARVRGQVG